MIELVGVSKKFGKRRILHNVNLKIGYREIIGIIGPNGAGKSVLLKTMAGFLKPDQGQVFSSGEVGISIQDNSFYESLTVKQNLKYFSRIYNVKDKEKINEIVEELGLKQFLNSNVNTLSGGTKKKLDLACSLLNDPSTLILDEPFTGLDKMYVNELVSLLIRLNNRGITLVISSHIVPHTYSLCSRFLVVQDETVKEISKERVKVLF